MEEEQTNQDCLFYNWGGNGTKERPSYPRVYGARCEFYDEFFSRNEKGELNPSCKNCQQTLEDLMDFII